MKLTGAIGAQVCNFKESLLIYLMIMNQNLFFSCFMRKRSFIVFVFIFPCKHEMGSWFSVAIMSTDDHFQLILFRDVPESSFYSPLGSYLSI